ncbi:DUF3967 domain-containing protein [Cytobacillus sp. FSL K6-0129]|uniref:DUF3967 domain-containing protein n=1 Tax=Cytobacillus sp. FSL K6-0129 TaxID=2921421 RepID=UPI0030F97990
MKNDSSVYTSKQVAKHLSIEPVTVRKYSQMLEDKGYKYKKDENNWRQYSEEDIKYLEYLIKLKKEDKTLNESVDYIASLYRSNLNISSTDMSLQEEENPLIQFMKKQEEFNEKLLQKLEDRDQQLMTAIQELQETKKQIAMTEEKNKHEKKWWKFWE